MSKNDDELFTIRALALAEGLNYATAIKRRAMSELGRLVPPGTWLVTKAQWEVIKKTPLPGCRKVRK